MQAADTWPVVWAFLAMLIALAEGIAIGRPAKEDTMTENWRRWLRGTVVGRLVVWPLWTWLTWHLMLDPAPGFNWVDVMSVLTGIGLAFVLPAWREPEDTDPVHIREMDKMIVRVVKERARDIQSQIEAERKRRGSSSRVDIHSEPTPELTEQLRREVQEELDRVGRDRADRAMRAAEAHRQARPIEHENDLDRITRVPPEFPPEESRDDGS